MTNKEKGISLFIVLLSICVLLPANSARAENYPTTLKVGQTKNIDVDADNKFDLQVEVLKINPDGRPVMKVTRLPYQNYIYSMNFMDYITSLYTNMVIVSAILSAIF
jgi:hypothetical protein